MKKFSKILVIVMVFALVLSMVPVVSTYATPKKAKAKVEYTFKKGVLTIKGKGKMPKSMTFKDNKKIKKVVIRKGVTSISNYAFSGCKNLKEVKIANTVKEIGWHSFEDTKIKKLVIPKSVKTIGNEAFYNCNKLTTITMPGSFKVKVMQGDEEDRGIMNGDKVKTVTFNTNFDIDTAMYLEGTKWKVRKNDPKFKSIDGVIYTKDGKEIVRVPSDRKELVIADGCETFCLQSIFYGEYVLHVESYVSCTKLEKVTIPASVKLIEDKKYKGKYQETFPMELRDITVNGAQLDSESIVTLVTNFKNIYYDDATSFDVDEMVEAFKGRIVVKDNFYILDNSILLHYLGNESTITVPSGIKIIADYAFDSGFLEGKGKIKKVILPEGIEEIGENAFYELFELEEINLPNSLKAIGTSAFGYTNLKKVQIPSNITKFGENIFEESMLKEVVLPDTMTVIPKGMFIYCTELEKINVPKNLTTIKQEAFYWAKVNVNDFLANKNLTTIGKNAFTGANWSDLVIPENIKKIGSHAFGHYTDDENTARTVIIEGKTSGFKADAFSSEDWPEGKNDVRLNFKTSEKNYFTDLYINSLTTYQNKANAVLEIYWAKVKNIDGYDIRVCSDKNYKKVIKKVNVKKNKITKIIKFSKKYKKVYVKMRPYKIVSGKKVYGRWDKEKIDI